MLRLATTVFLIGSTAALAQGPNGTAHHHGQGQMNQAAMMQHGKGMIPTQSGQSAFAAIQEIIQLLEADPATDWSKVNIEALRQHLIDMDSVTLHAAVRSIPVEGGIKFTVTGTGDVRNSIRRMVAAHAATMSGVGGWNYASAEVADGASLTLTVPAHDLPKLKALGFIGAMTVGMHHQEHQLMIAKGSHPHN